MSPPKPTVVIVPGAWHPSASYASLTSALQTAGYPSLTAHLPSLCPVNPSNSSCATDAESVRQQILPLIETERKAIILLSHSYGGIPAGGAARGLSKTSRSKIGLEGGVIALVYMSAFIVPEGQSLLKFIGGEHSPFILQGTPSPDLCTVANPLQVFYADVFPPVRASAIASSLLPHAMSAFESPAPRPVWAEKEFEGDLVFLRCLQDAALPVFVQDTFVQKCEAEWTVRNIDASHSPFASMPEEVVKVLEEVLGKKGKGKEEEDGAENNSGDVAEKNL